MIDRCICYNLSFLLILEMARTQNLSSVEEIQKTGICNKCCLCSPYIKKSLETGLTKFQNVLK